MAKRIGLSVPLIFIILMCTTTCLKPASVRPGKYDHSFLQNLPSARVRKYRIRITNSSGAPIRNERIHMKQVRQSFMLNNREEFTNFIWLETSDKIIIGFDSKRSITAEDIIEALGLGDLAKEDSLDMYLDLRIPVSFTSEGRVPEGTDVAEYESVETYALKQYHEAFRITGVISDYVHILAEFNQKMNLDMHFDTKAAVEFADGYIRMARELFPESKIVVDLGPLYCFDDFWYPIGPDGGCIHELKEGKIPDHMEFLKMLQEKGSPYDIIGIEYQPGSHHSPEIEHFRVFLDKLSGFGKPIFIWEFWVPGGDFSEEVPNYGMYAFNRPVGGWTEEYQKSIFQQVLEYINANPQIMGLTQFGWVDCITDCGPSPPGLYGLIREDGTKKPSYYVMQDWCKSWFTECDLTTDSEGRASFPGLPGRYRISKGLLHRKTVDMVEDTAEIEIPLE